MRKTAETLRRLYERNEADAHAHSGLAMFHWEFNLDSPLLGDKHHFGCVDFKLERLKISERQKSRLTVGFFTSGIVGYSKRGKGWLFFSSGSKGQPELAEATAEQRRKLPRLPAGWESNIEEVD